MQVPVRACRYEFKHVHVRVGFKSPASSFPRYNLHLCVLSFILCLSRISHLEFEVNDKEVTCSDRGKQPPRASEKNKFINPLLRLVRPTPVRNVKTIAEKKY